MLESPNRARPAWSGRLCRSLGAAPVSVVPPAGKVPEHFDAVIVGSGFGGSVSAARLADAGWRVCVLERGKSYPPGSFPRTPLGIKRNLWDPGKGLHGMFDLWSFSRIDALCASGLGGGSLIYANVLLRKDEHWFVHDPDGAGHEDWPVTRADLDPHYDRVERRIGKSLFPVDVSPYDSTPKVRAYQEAAERLGAEWSLLPLGITFAGQNGRRPVPGEPIVEPPNLHGHTRSTCRLCGECDIGCNYGSKNTLDYTYLSDAWRKGAELRTLCEVRAFEPRESGGYDVHYVVHDPDRAASTDTLERHTVSCRHLVLSAGTLGTTRLLLRNRPALPGLSDQLGYGFSGNGDLLTFAIRCRKEGGPRVIEPARGPVITSAIWVPDSDVDPGTPPAGLGRGRGFYLEDAGSPAFVSWMLEVLEEPKTIARAAPKLAHFLLSVLRHRRQSEIGGLASALLGEWSAAIFPMLGMGRDIPDGRMTLQDDRLECDWSRHGASAGYFDRVRRLSRMVADTLGGVLIDDPIWYERRLITVHALGGCRMGRSPQAGVVDSFGNVFGCPGLHIADGSVMPGPVGANPSLTIAALADRFADRMLA